MVRLGSDSQQSATVLLVFVHVLIYGLVLQLVLIFILLLLMLLMTLQLIINLIHDPYLPLISFFMLRWSLTAYKT